MDTRFTDIQPLTCDKPEYGAEPALLDVLTEYYSLNSVEPKKARQLATAYVKEWTRLEAEARTGG
jgi:hypothetical protein